MAYYYRKTLPQLGPPLERVLAGCRGRARLQRRRLGFPSPEMVGMMAAPPNPPAETASDLLAAAMFADDTPAKLKHLRLLRSLLLRNRPSSPSLLPDFAPRLLDLRSDSSGPVRQFLVQYVALSSTSCCCNRIFLESDVVDMFVFMVSIIHLLICMFRVWLVFGIEYMRCDDKVWIFLNLRIFCMDVWWQCNTGMCSYLFFLCTKMIFNCRVLYCRLVWYFFILPY